MKNKIIFLLFLVVVAFCAYSFFTLFERYEEEKDQGWEKKALRNPYLAAEQFLVKQGIKVTSTNDFEKLENLPEEGLIFISDARKILTKKRVDSLLEWVGQGGHLIITAPIYNKNNPNPLFSKFNVENHELAEDEETEDDSDLETKKLSEQLNELNEKNNTKKNQQNAQNKDDDINEDEITTLYFTDIEQILKMSFSSRSSLKHPFLTKDDDYVETDDDPSYWAGDEFGTHFMQFNVDQGLISIITDKTIWQSVNIDLLDHAHLLWLLSDNTSEVVLLYGANIPSIFDYLWLYASELIMAFTLWLLAWLVYRARRLGKIHFDTSTKRQSIAEHISASAAYLWNNKKFDQLLTPVRNEILFELNRLHFSFSSLNQTEQINFISSHCDIESSHINEVLFQPFIGRENEFIYIITYLQKIRSSL